jgi:hypothetical protein
MTLSDIHLSFLRRAAESAVSADMDVAVSPNILFALLDEIGLHRAVCNLVDPSAKVLCSPAHRVSGVCAVGGCDRPVTGLSLYCKKHKMRAVRHGDPTVKLKPWGRKEKQ